MLAQRLGQLGEGHRRHGQIVDQLRAAAQPFLGLGQIVHSVLDESQVYRIDHFLGKEGTQNLHVLRFANGLIDAMWSRE
ncbi:MAG TPA: hypothetical protein VGI21_00620, partial [Streptosporangiaceae bacterium]